MNSKAPTMGDVVGADAAVVLPPSDAATPVIGESSDGNGEHD